MPVTQCNAIETHVMWKCVQTSKTAVIGRDSQEKKRRLLAETANSGLIPRFSQIKIVSESGSSIPGPNLYHMAHMIWAIWSGYGP